MVKGAVVGLGKMGLSHQAILNAHPDVDLVAICDSSAYLLGILGKYTGVATYSDYEKMLDEARPDFVLIATPSSLHAPMVRAALERDIHVFCEKPFCLTGEDGAELVREAAERKLVSQVGYHNRFVGAFQEARRLVDAGAIGEITHVLAEAYGPVVLRPQGGTWRSKSNQGGGCLYDYAAHPINLVNWLMGSPVGVGGTVLNRIFSKEIDDEVSSTLYFANGATAQVSVNWSDESVRKMTTRLTIWGTGGRIFVDRQECQAYLREESTLEGYGKGWNVRYTTDLTAPVNYYLRGEEYSAQIDHFVACVVAGKSDPDTDFASAVATDRVIELMIADAAKGPTTFDGQTPPAIAEDVAVNALLRQAAAELRRRAGHYRVAAGEKYRDLRQARSSA